MGPWREQEAPEGGVGVWPQPLRSQAQVKVQLKKFHCPMGAKWELLGPGHHKGRRQATQGAGKGQVGVAAPLAHVSSSADVAGNEAVLFV